MTRRIVATQNITLDGVVDARLLPRAFSDGVSRQVYGLAPRACVSAL